LIAAKFRWKALSQPSGQLGALELTRVTWSTPWEAVMEEITADMKVAQVLRLYPETLDVFLCRGCPDMRRGFFNVMARLMSVRNAARIHKLALEPLIADLNRVARGAKG
jgi:hypothetical protein